ncbi:MAG: hypothetical protein ACI4RP_02015, partial [Acutalibacteraceae bacterium]
IIFSLIYNTADSVIVGADNGTAYTIKVSKLNNTDWRFAVGDFIGYCNDNQINAILEMSQSDYDDAIQQYNGHSFNESFLREYEPEILIHSTTMESWINIQRDGMLKSWNKLKAENMVSEEQPIGMQLGDPISFSDYIMFGGGVTGEIVVHSKQVGKIVMDINAEYKTGARLYFDAKKIAEDGLLIRDGCHLKVKDALPLTPYLIWAATWDKIGLSSPISTPKIFSEAADKRFRVHRF